MKADFITNLGEIDMPTDSYERLFDIIDGQFGQLEQAVRDCGRTESDYPEQKEEPPEIVFDEAEVEDACEILDSVLTAGDGGEEAEEAEVALEQPQVPEETDDAADAEGEDFLENNENAFDDAQKAPESDQHGERGASSPADAIATLRERLVDDYEPHSPVTGGFVSDERNKTSHWLSDDEDGSTSWNQARDLSSVESIGESPAPTPGGFPESQGRYDLSFDEDNIDFDDFEDLEFEISFEEDGDDDYEYDDGYDDVFSTYVEIDGGEAPIKTMNYAPGHLGPVDDTE